MAILAGLYHRAIRFLRGLVYEPFNEQYRHLLEAALEDGIYLPDRTGTGRYSIPNGEIVVDLQRELPICTLRETPLVSPCGEMIGFLRGFDNSRLFAEQKCKFWNLNANNNAAWLKNPFRKGLNDIGAVYGVQWRKWLAHTEYDTPEQYHALRDSGWTEGVDFAMTKTIDQVAEAIRLMIVDPTSRRILWHGWNPAAMHEVALPPCHLLYQWVVLDDVLHLTVYQRSADLILGVPSNVLQGAVLTHLMGQITGYRLGTLRYVFGDAHLYADHLDAAEEMVHNASIKPHGSVGFNRDFRIAPEKATVEYIGMVLDSLDISDINIRCKNRGPKIDPSKLKMAV